MNMIYSHWISLHYRMNTIRLFLDPRTICEMITVLFVYMMVKLTFSKVTFRVQTHNRPQIDAPSTKELKMSVMINVFGEENTEIRHLMGNTSGEA